MPKLKGPMFSLEASGTLGNTIVFETRPEGARARKKRIKLTVESPLQMQQRGSVANMAKTWRIMFITQKELWQDAATPYGITGYQLFWREYIAQMILWPGVPTIP